MPRRWAYLAAMSILLATAIRSPGQSHDGRFDYATTHAVVAEHEVPPGTRNLVLAGDLVVAKVVGGIRIWRSNQPGELEPLGFVSLDGDYVRDLHLVGSTVVARGEFTWWIIDIGDPMAPQVVASGVGTSLTDSDAAHGLLALGTLSGAVHLRDLTTPAAPELLSVLSPFSYPKVALFDGRLVVNDGGQSYLYDIIDPTAPQLLDQIPHEQYIREFVNAHGRLVVVEFQNGIHVYDVTSRPAFTTLGGVNDGVDYAHVSADAELLYACLADESGADVFRLGEWPAMPRVAEHRYLTSGVEAEPQGDRLLVNLVGRPAALAWIDPRRVCRRPAPLWTLATDGYCLWAAMHRDHIYGSGHGFNRLDVVSIRPGVPPRHVGSLPLDRQPLGLEVHGELLLVAAGDPTGLLCVDLAEPDVPALLGSIDLPALHAAWDVAAVGDRAYLAMQHPDGGIAVVDVADPTQPAFLYLLALPSRLTAIAARGSHLVACCTESDSLYVAFIDEGASPPLTITHRLAIPHELGSVDGVEFDGDVCWVLGNRGVLSMRLTVDGRLEPLGYWPQLGRVSPNTMVIRDGFLFAAAMHNGCQILDVADPVHPTRVGQTPDLGMALAVAVDQQAIHLLHQDGLIVAWPLPRRRAPAVVTCEAAPRPESAVVRSRLLDARVAGDATVQLALDRNDEVTVAVYDLRGRRVAVIRSGRLAVGEHRFVWDGRDARGRRAPAGVYLLRVAGRHWADVHKLTVVR